MAANPTHPSAVRLAELVKDHYIVTHTATEIRFACKYCHQVWGITRTVEPSYGTAQLIILHTLTHDYVGRVPPTTEF